MKKKLCLLSLMAIAAVGICNAKTTNIPDMLSQAFETEVYADDGTVTVGGVKYLLSSDDEYARAIDVSGASVTDVYIPSTVSGRPVYVSQISGWPYIQSIEVADGVAGFNDGAFRGLSALKSITINCPMETIPAEFLYGCSSLTDLTLPSGIKTVGQGAFYGCSSLQKIELGSVTSIKANAFYGCSSLKDLTFSKDLKTLGSQALVGCTGIEKIIIPGTVSGMDYTTFQGCKNIKEVTLYGNAPNINPFVNSGSTGATLYYIEGTTGWDTAKTAKGYTKIFSNFIALSAAEALPNGDIDASGGITKTDAALMLKKISNPSYKANIENISNDYIGFIDTNGDTQFNLLDPINLMINNPDVFGSSESTDTSAESNS